MAAAASCAAATAPALGTGRNHQHAGVAGLEQELAAGQAPAVHVELEGGIPEPVADYAREKIGQLTRYAHRPVLLIKIRLTQVAHRAGAKISGQAIVDINGRPLVSHAVGSSGRETVDLLQAKLRDQLRHLRPARRTGPLSKDPRRKDQIP